MAKVLFWNIQRSGGNDISETMDNLRNDLIILAKLEDPELIILCEGLKGLGKAFNAPDVVPEYERVKPVKHNFAYKDEHVLRYVLLAKKGVSCSATLIDSKASRPGLHMQWTDSGNTVQVAAAIHAPSVSASVAPQTRAIRKVLKHSSTHGCPKVIFGDLNIDLGDQKKVQRALGTLNAAGFHGYVAACPPKPTHDGGRSLDGAFYLSSLPQAVTVDVCEPARAAKVPRYTTAADDEEWAPDIENSKGSDHRPIVVRW